MGSKNTQDDWRPLRAVHSQVQPFWQPCNCRSCNSFTAAAVSPASTI